MFMLVVAMDPEFVEKTQIPQPDQKQTAEDMQSRTIVIQVVWTTKNQPPTVKINQDDVQWKDLETRLTEIYLKRAEKVAFVRGDADVDFQYVADVIDLAHHAGVQRVGLLTQGRALPVGRVLHERPSAGEEKVFSTALAGRGAQGTAVMIEYFAVEELVIWIVDVEQRPGPQDVMQKNDVVWHVTGEMHRCSLWIGQTCIAGGREASKGLSIHRQDVGCAFFSGYELVEMRI